MVLGFGKRHDSSMLLQNQKHGTRRYNGHVRYFPLRTLLIAFAVGVTAYFICSSVRREPQPRATNQGPGGHFIVVPRHVWSSPAGVPRLDSGCFVAALRLG